MTVLSTSAEIGLNALDPAEREQVKRVIEALHGGPPWQLPPEARPRKLAEEDRGQIYSVSVPNSTLAVIFRNDHGEIEILEIFYRERLEALFGPRNGRE